MARKRAEAAGAGIMDREAQWQSDPGDFSQHSDVGSQPLGEGVSTGHCGSLKLSLTNQRSRMGVARLFGALTHGD